MPDQIANSQRSPGKSLRGWIAVFSVFLALCLIVTLINIPITKIIFSPDFYARVLVDQNLYKDLPVVVAHEMIKTAAGSNENS